MRKSIIVMFLTVLLITACGGGGSGSTPQPTASANVPTGTTPPVVMTTSALQVAPDFKLQTYRMLLLQVDVSTRMSGRLFINVCALTTDSEPRLDYTNCLLSASLVDGKMQTELAISHSIQGLGAEVVDTSTLFETTFVHWSASELATTTELLVN